MSDLDLLDEGEYEDDDIPQIIGIQIIRPPEVEKNYIGYFREEKYSYNSAINSILRTIKKK